MVSLVYYNNVPVWLAHEVSIEVIKNNDNHKKNYYDFLCLH